MQKLLDAIYANPADDAPRLVYADYLQEAGDPRGEFIAVQCELARLGYGLKPSSWEWFGDALGDESDPAQLRKLRMRETALLKKHGTSWVKEASLRAVTFERGFVAHYAAVSFGGDQKALTAFMTSHPLCDSLGIAVQEKDMKATMAWPGWSALRAIEVPLHTLEGLIRVATTRLRSLSVENYERVKLPVPLLDWAPLGQLTTLRLPMPMTAPEARKLLAACGPLDELQLRAAKLGPAGGEIIAKAKSAAKLRILSVIGNSVGAEGTIALMTLKHLRALDIRKSGIGVRGAAALGGHPALRTIDLTGNTVTAEVMEALCGGSGLRSLSELCLQATRVDDDALAILAKSPLLGRLTSLNLRSNKITDRGAKLLAKSKHASNLRTINLNNNEITVAGKQALTDSKFFANARITLLAY